MVLALLEEARNTPTGQLWVDCLVTPDIIADLFIRVEHEANWELHMYALQRILPYFFSWALALC